jgi:quinol monooxygenase YgiN
VSVIVVATIRPQEGYRDEVLAALEDAVGRVHAEDEGCELYALHESADAFVMIEKWSSFETLKAHGQSPAFLELSSKLKEKVAEGLDVQVLTPRPLGTATQGAL